MDPGTEQLGGDTGKTGTTGNLTEPYTAIAKLSPKERHIVARMVETAFNAGKKARVADRDIAPLEFAQKEWGWLYQGLHPGNTPFTGDLARGTESYGGSVGQSNR